MESSEFILKLDKDADELYSEANQVISFTAILQSVASRYLSRVSVDLQGPPEVKIIRSHKVVGGMMSGSRRRVSFRIHPQANGLHILNATVNIKQIPNCTIPIILRVGQESLNIQAPELETTPLTQGSTMTQSNLTQGISNSMVRFTLKDNAEAVYCGAGKYKEFYLTIQNISSVYLPRVKIQLFGPPEVKIMTSTSFIGGVSRGSKKSRLFKIKASADGVFTLTANLMYKNGQLATLPFEVRVGPNWMQYKSEIPADISTPIETSAIPKEEIPIELITCPFCGMETDSDSKFCSSCGTEMTIKVKTPEKEQLEKFCSECGENNSPEARFCRICGTALKE